MTHEPQPLRVYLLVYVALLVLLVATVAVAYVDLGPWGIVLALSIAVVKALLVLLYFMHVRTSNRLVWVFAIAGFAWLAIMLVGILQDYLSRPWVGS
jgi:cytochrome c oxidase subunit IV